MKLQLIVMLLILLPGTLALQWSEIMFNPQGSDTGREFVELSGNDSLVGCTIRDMHGGSRLNILQEGTNDLILIITNPSLVSYDGNATVYSVGKSIITDLPNTADTLNISCNNTILTTSYNISLLSGYAEGASIFFQNNQWIVGPMNGTPGSKNDMTSSAPNTTNTSSNSSSNTSSPNKPCNASLVMTLSATHGIVGDRIGFTIISEGLASYEASANGTVFASGDTLTTNEHSIILPNTTAIKLTAYANACQGRQRATRLIAVDAPKIENEEQTETVTTTIATTPTTATAEKIVPATGAVVMDQNSSMVPWIALFGSVTVIASTIVFLQLLRREQQ